MKENRKERGLRAGDAAVWIACVALFACHGDDTFEELRTAGAGDRIGFGIRSGAAVRTRGEVAGPAGETPSVRLVLRTDGAADTLCACAVVTEGIAAPAVGETAPATRGAAVTQTDFYGAFRVLAYRRTAGAEVGPSFYMNETATAADGNLWTCGQAYYWPGTGQELRFCAWAPGDAGWTATPATPASTALEYVVPAEATAQKDLVVAATDFLPGDFRREVPLTFRHICTAVRFATGSRMPPGEIRSVALRGVRNSGTYDMAAGTWTPGESVADFLQALDVSVDGTEPDGTGITSEEETFMMLPQSLEAGARVEVVFHDRASDRDRTFSASLEGGVWPAGRTVTYKLSLSPEGRLEITVPEKERTQDAHYVSFPITVTVENFTGEWQLTSGLPADVFFTATRTDLQEQGYWIDEDKGTASVTGRGPGTFLYYVYVTENVADEVRNIELQVKPVEARSGVAPFAATVRQLCPAWDGNLGCERLEDGDYPWGFKWPEGYKVKYDMGTGFGSFLLGMLIRLFGLADYAKIENIGILRPVTVTIDYAKVEAADVALSRENGRENTLELYDYQGISNAANLEYTLGELGGVRTVEPEGATLLNPTEFAARACAMKNLFTKRRHTEGGQTVEIPVLRSMDWYLPAEAEAVLLRDPEFPLAGDYWTSTAVNDNTNAYKVNGGRPEPHDRAASFHVRAVRRRP